MPKVPKRALESAKRIVRKSDDRRQVAGRILDPTTTPASRSGKYEVRTFAANRNRDNVGRGDLVSIHDTLEDAQNAAHSLFKVVWHNVLPEPRKLSEDETDALLDLVAIRMETDSNNLTPPTDEEIRAYMESK